MGLVMISGPAGNVQQETEVYGAQSSAYTGMTKVHSQKLVNFRVGNKPVTMKLKATIDLAEGDDATVVGTERNGILRAVAVRNDKTGVVYSHSPILLMFCGVLLALGGWVFLSVLIGYLMIPAGLYVAYKGLQTKQALGMLKSQASLASAS